MLIQGRRHGFLSEGANRRQVANLLQNILKIEEKYAGFGPFILETGGDVPS